MAIYRKLLPGGGLRLLLDGMYSRGDITGRDEPGTVFEIDPAGLSPVASPSPHYAGLPELFGAAEQLGLEFPSEVRIIAIEVADPHTIGGEMTPAVEAALDELCRQARAAACAGCSSVGAIAH